MNNPDGIDRTTVVNVIRDDGDPAKAEDWFELCNLGRYKNAIEFIGTYIDESGSTKFVDIEASAILFARKLRCAGISVDYVFGDTTEDWIKPFLTSLKPDEGTAECGNHDELCGSGQSCNQGICEGTIVEDECTTPT